MRSGEREGRDQGGETGSRYAMTPALQARPWLGYAAALLLPLLSLAIRFALGAVLDGFPFLTFVPAVLGTAVLGGWRAGAAATVVSELLAAYFLIEPRFSFDVGGPAGLVGLVFFNLVCAIIVALMHATGTAMGRLDAAGVELRRINELLELRVVERTRELADANAALRAEIGARKAIEAQMVEAQKLDALGQLTGGIAHDFNNMLQAIGGSLEMMRRRLAKGRPEQLERYLAAAGDAVDRAAALTQGLLAFARRQTLAPAPVDPNALIEGLAPLIRRTVGPEIEVAVASGQPVWPVLCDPGQLESALVNLALNARDAMQGGGVLTVATANCRLAAADLVGRAEVAAGDYVQISVADTGTGMTPDVLAHAFDPFFTTKPLGRGTGLGLSHLYGFVRQSQGDVRLDSAPGLGTTVRIYLPRSAPASSGAALASEAAPRRPEGAVLLVEDEALVRAVAAEALRELGCAVIEAGDGAEALRLLEQGEAADVLVTDVGLPGGLNGRQLADAVRERRPGIPVLLITGYAGAALASELASGMKVLAKPFPLETLVATVRQSLHQAGAAVADAPASCGQ